MIIVMLIVVAGFACAFWNFPKPYFWREEDEE